MEICQEFLLDQDISRDEYEVICVNDGSTDGSLEILKEYENNYSNITVIGQNNLDVCASRVSTYYFCRLPNPWNSLIIVAVK